MPLNRRQRKAMERYCRRDENELRESGMHQAEFEYHMHSRTAERAYPGFVDGRIVHSEGVIMTPPEAEHQWALAFWSEDSRGKEHDFVHVIGYSRMIQYADGSKFIQTAEFILFQDMGYDKHGVPYGMWRYRVREDGLNLIHLRRLD